MTTATKQSTVKATRNLPADVPQEQQQSQPEAVDAMTVDFNALPPQPSRNATPEDVEILANVARRLSVSEKALKAAIAAVQESYVGGDRHALRSSRDAMQAKHDRVLDESWVVLRGLPAGTNVSAGVNAKGVALTASPQSVAMQFHNRGLNRNLNLRQTSGDARTANKRAFNI